MSTADLRRHHHHRQPSLPPIVKLRLKLLLLQSTRGKGMFTSLPVQDTGRKYTEPVNPNAFPVHDSTESLHLGMYKKKELYTLRALHATSDTPTFKDYALFVRPPPSRFPPLYGVPPAFFAFYALWISSVVKLAFLLSASAAVLVFLRFLSLLEAVSPAPPSPLSFPPPSRHHPPHGRLRSPYTCNVAFQLGQDANSPLMWSVHHQSRMSKDQMHSNCNQASHRVQNLDRNSVVSRCGSLTRGAEMRVLRA